MKAVIFDLDDTLYPESQYVESGFKRVSRYIEQRYGYVNIYATMQELFIADRKNVFDRLLKGLDVNFTKADVDHMIDMYITNKPDKLHFYEGADKLLKCLKDKGVRLGILTDGRVVQQNAKINALGIRDYFDNITISDEIGGIEYRKPNKQIYLYVASKLNVRVEDMIYVGDNPEKDFVIKTELPITTVRILTNGLYGKAEYKSGVKPDYIADSYESLTMILTEILDKE